MHMHESSDRPDAVGKGYIVGLWRAAALALGRLALDTVLPPRCLSCDAVVGGIGMLCPRCWDSMRFITAPHCARCGLPFPYDLDADAICGACAEEPPRFNRARAVLVYDEASRGMILSFKHGDRVDMVPSFARWMASAAPDLVRDCTSLVPVPLHRFRLLHRRYNQSALLANAISGIAGRPVIHGVLRRIRRTAPLGTLSPAARRRALAGAFDIAPSQATRVQGHRVLLIDDVLTSGATANACARSLLNSGAESVDLLTVARAMRAQ